MYIPGEAIYMYLNNIAGMLLLLLLLNQTRGSLDAARDRVRDF